MDAAHRATDEELARIERRLHEIYARAEKELGETWKLYLEESGKQIADLQSAYDAAKAAGNQAEIRKAGRALSAAKREATIMDTHYRKMTETLAAEISHINETAIAYVNGQLPEIYALNYNGFADAISGSLGGVSFELVDASTVRRLSLVEENLLPYKTVNGKKDVRWNIQRINAEVTQGIIQGEPMDKIATRFQNVLGMNETSAIRNARTSVTAAENKGRMDMLHDAREKGVLANKVWLATNDSRTREAHAELDGTEEDVDTPFENEFGYIMYPGDPDAEPANTYNCRCTLTYKVIGFAK